MFAVSVRHTEQGYLNRNRQILAEARRQHEQEARLLSAQLAQEELARAAEIVELRRASEDRQAIMAAERRALNISFKHTYRDIERRACRLFRTKPSEIHSDRRNREIVFARQFVMYWTARLTKLSLPQVGRLMGGKDHTTILHGKNKYVEKRARMGRYLRAAR